MVKRRRSGGLHPVRVGCARSRPIRVTHFLQPPLLSFLSQRRDTLEETRDKNKEIKMRRKNTNRKQSVIVAPRSGSPSGK